MKAVASGSFAAFGRDAGLKTGVPAFGHDAGLKSGVPSSGHDAGLNEERRSYFFGKRCRPEVGGRYFFTTSSANRRRRLAEPGVWGVMARNSSMDRAPVSLR